MSSSNDILKKLQQELGNEVDAQKYYNLCMTANSPGPESFKAKHELDEVNKRLTQKLSPQSQQRLTMLMKPCLPRGFNFSLKPPQPN